LIVDEPRRVRFTSQGVTATGGRSASLPSYLAMVMARHVFSQSGFLDCKRAQSSPQPPFHAFLSRPSLSGPAPARRLSTQAQLHRPLCLHLSPPPAHGVSTGTARQAAGRPERAERRRRRCNSGRRRARGAHSLERSCRFYRLSCGVGAQLGAVALRAGCTREPAAATRRTKHALAALRRSAPALDCAAAARHAHTSPGGLGEAETQEGDEPAQAAQTPPGAAQQELSGRCCSARSHSEPLHKS
jgi:hypothetical protein